MERWRGRNKALVATTSPQLSHHCCHCRCPPCSCPCPPCPPCPCPLYYCGKLFTSFEEEWRDGETGTRQCRRPPHNYAIIVVIVVVLLVIVLLVIVLLVVVLLVLVLVLYIIVERWRGRNKALVAASPQLSHHAAITAPFVILTPNQSRHSRFLAQPEFLSFELLWQLHTYTLSGVVSENFRQCDPETFYF